MMKTKKKIKHKYLHELFPDGKITWPYGEKDYPDFDERDTYSMDATLAAWLYERLRYFQDVVIGVIDFEWEPNSVCVDDEILTQRQCIDRMVKDCATILTVDEFTNFEEVDAAKDDLFKVLSKVYWAMWW